MWVTSMIICAPQQTQSLSRHFMIRAYNRVTDGILQVDAYEQGRPGYPLDAVHYALKEAGLDTGRKRIVDLAAGTGKLTRSALQHCHSFFPHAEHDPQSSHAKRRLQ